MKKSSLVLILAAVAATVAAGAWWRSKGSGPTAPEAAASAPKPAQVVTLATVQRRDMPVSVEAAGTVVPLNTVDLRPQISSMVRQVVVKEGQMVRQGDLLFRFDDRTEQANLDKARAQLARSQVALADLERQWKRSQELRAQNFISQGAADTVLANLEAQRAAVVADQAAVKAGEVAAGYATLRAPLAGRVGLVNVYPGSLVSPTGASPLATIAQIDPIGVSFTLPEAQLGALLRGGDEGRGAQGAQLQVMLPAAAGSRGGAPREAMQGTVSVIDNAVDTSTGSIRVKGALANPKQQLWPGQYVTVRLTLRTIQDAAVLPVVALVQRGQERSVYVVKSDMTVELRPVQLRYSSGESAVVEGVQPGERVVVEGKQNLRPGGLVREAPAGPAKAASGAASAPASGASA
jgi:membrane fusion protein, multidrug efflux system